MNGKCLCADESSASPVRQLLESIPASVQQDARRAQALVLKQQGDTAAAQQLLADLVQSEELSQQVQHLAQANYGTLLLEQGNFQVYFDCFCGWSPIPSACRDCLILYRNTE